MFKKINSTEFIQKISLPSEFLLWKFKNSFENKVQ